MNENTLKKEFERIYFDIETILPDKVLELVYEHHYPHCVPDQPLTLESLNAIREIHAKHVAAVASVVGCSTEELTKTLDRIYQEDCGRGELLLQMILNAFVRVEDTTTQISFNKCEFKR